MATVSPVLSDLTPASVTVVATKPSQAEEPAGRPVVIESIQAWFWMR